MKNTNKLLLVLALLFSGQLMAANLTSAKSAGFIGEQANGYIGFVKSAHSDVRVLVGNVNNKRKARYKTIAKKQKISLSDVEKIGGKKAISKTKSGNYVKRSGKGWSKK